MDTNFWIGFAGCSGRRAVFGKPLRQVFDRISCCPEQEKSCQASGGPSSGNTNFSCYLAVSGASERHGLHDASGGVLAAVRWYQQDSREGQEKAI